jgi:hypothetical protein
MPHVVLEGYTVPIPFSDVLGVWFVHVAVSQTELYLQQTGNCSYHLKETE